ncbi:hypothetical protein V8G54_033240 [Vigna mungo]|uniref:Hexosyltransferase n=1 Tax=Vigna mungo TaxID=3915 RepID=A0AAQ3RIN6_VIGMU
MIEWEAALCRGTHSSRLEVASTQPEKTARVLVRDDGEKQSWKIQFNFQIFQSPPEKKKREKALANRIRVIMKPNSVTWWLWCVGSKTKRTDEAYVTLLYGDEFLLGVRVLGKSIRNTGSSKDMVVLVSDGVSDYAKSLLRADGWIVELISLLANPNRVRPKRFWGVYTKLKIFNMTDYKKVVYLDADTIVVKNIDDLFKCVKFCANLKHSERLNSGVMVVEPSQTVFNDMISKIKTTASYTGGDQGFLNSYFSGFPNAHVFEPNLSPEVLNTRPVPEMERLSTLYNADVGLYMLANKLNYAGSAHLSSVEMEDILGLVAQINDYPWMVDENELRVIHYTLGPLKPWDWWTSWLLKPVDVWQDVREQLEESLPGTGGGQNPKDRFIVKFLFLLPLCALLFLCYRSFMKGTSVHFVEAQYVIKLDTFIIRLDQTGHFLILVFRHQRLIQSIRLVFSSVFWLLNGTQNKVPAYLGGVSVCVCFMVAVVSLGLSLLIVPRQVMPWTGLLLMYEWTYTIFLILFGGYLRLIYQWGKMVGSRVASSLSDHDSEKRMFFKSEASFCGHQRQVSSCDVATWYYGLGMALLAIAAPSLPCLFGITALFAR